MITSFFLKIFPYFLLVSFIFFEFAPGYFFEKEIIKPFFTFIVLYALVNNNAEKFRPFWILLFGILYDFLDGQVIGITSLFFLIILHFLRRKHSTIISVDFKNIWVNFVGMLTAYVFVNQLTHFIFFNETIEIKRILLSLLISIIMFPLFNSLIKKFNKFGFSGE